MKYILTILIVVISNFGSGQTMDPDLKSILDTVILRTKESSYYSQTVNWDSLETKIYQSAEGADELDDLKPAFTDLINGIRDHHGRIMKTSDYSLLASFTDHKNSRSTDDRKYDSETWTLVNNLESRFEYSVLSDSIGYLKVVAVGSNVDGQTEAERIRAAIRELHELNVNHWIIDLRYNAGGNVNVMLSGLAPLLNSGVVASIQMSDKQIQGTAEIKNGNFWYFGINAFELTDQLRINNPKIAVLTSRWTASSGELVAVAFKEQDRTLFLGESTGGYTTNTGWNVINNEIALIIGTGVFCDRKGNSYDQNVPSDVEIVFEVETDKFKDKGIDEAVKWLLTQDL